MPFPPQKTHRLIRMSLFGTSRPKPKLPFGAQSVATARETAEQEKLHYIAYPERFDAEQGRVVFNHSIQTVNNERLAPMPLPNVLLVVSSPLANPQQKHLWRSTKQGEQLQLVATIEAPSSWHLDVGNGLLRLLHPQAQGLTIEEIPWHTTP